MKLVRHSSPSRWTPPPLVFQIVWPILYVMMAVSCLLYALHGGGAVGYGLFAFQLFLNVLWTVLFFSLGWRRASLVDLVLLLGVVFATTWVFWSVYWLAGALLVPYFAWLVFALCLFVNNF